jgi:hypothetical protein
MVRAALQFITLRNLAGSLGPFVGAIRRSLPSTRLRQRERLRIADYTGTESCPAVTIF